MTADEAGREAVARALGDTKPARIPWNVTGEVTLPRTSRLKGPVYDLTIRSDEMTGVLVNFAYTDTEKGNNTASFTSLEDALAWIGMHVRMEPRDAGPQR
jgi:hypothetical protein